MPVPISVIRDNFQKQGLAWSPTDYDEIVAKYGEQVVLDEPRPGAPPPTGLESIPAQNVGTPAQVPTNRGGLLPGRRTTPSWDINPWEPIGGPEGQPVADPTLSNMLTRGFMPGLLPGTPRAEPVSSPEGASPAERYITEKLAEPFGFGAGMVTVLPLLPFRALQFAKAPNLLGRYAGRAVPAAQKFFQHGALTGATEGLRRGLDAQPGLSDLITGEYDPNIGGPLEEAAKGALGGGLEGAKLAALLGLLPGSFPKWLGGRYGQGAAIGGGLGTAHELEAARQATARGEEYKPDWGKVAGEAGIWGLLPAAERMAGQRVFPEASRGMPRASGATAALPPAPKGYVPESLPIGEMGVKPGLPLQGRSAPTMPEGPEFVPLPREPMRPVAPEIGAPIEGAPGVPPGAPLNARLGMGAPAPANLPSDVYLGSGLGGLNDPVTRAMKETGIDWRATLGLKPGTGPKQEFIFWDERPERPVAHYTDPIQPRPRGTRKMSFTPGEGRASVESRLGEYTPLEKPAKDPGALPNAARAIASRLERMSPEAQAVGKMLNESVDLGEYANVGLHSEKIIDAGIGKLRDAEGTRVGRALEGKLDPRILSPRGRAVYDATKETLQGVSARARPHMKLRRAHNGAWIEVPFPEAKENYLPRFEYETSKLKKGRAREEAIQNAVDDKYFASKEEAAKALDSWIDIKENGGDARLKSFADWMMKRGQATSVEEAIGKITLAPNDPEVRSFGPGEYVREYDNPFYKRNVKEIIEPYITNMERRIAESAVYGQHNEKLNEAVGKIKSPKEREAVESALKVARGIIPREDAATEKVLSGLRTWGGMKISPLTTLRNLTGANNTIMETDAITFLKSLPSAVSHEGRMRAHKSGGTAGPMLSSQAGESSFMKKYYKANLFTPSEIGLRTSAAKAGSLYAPKLAKNLFSAYEKGKVDAWARFWLQDKGVAPADVIKQRGVLTDEQLLTIERKTALKTQHSYHPKDLPQTFSSSSAHKTFYQFRPYATQQYRFLTKNTVDLLKPDAFGSRHRVRALRNIAILATLYPVSGEVVNDMVALIKGEKRTSNLVNRWLQNCVNSGAASTFADAISALSVPGRLASGAAGPALGAPAEIGELGLSIARGGMSDAKARRIVREIPWLGPILAPRLYPYEEEASDSPKQPPRRAVSHPRYRRSGSTP